ncbi:MAG: PTS sugar transporter subunit IIA [Candidatus Zixiibacteriota bacterium]|nr:MAG: PTS sugar transporter subunit IIA [candidate division Zixibacteria bacterium]
MRLANMLKEEYVVEDLQATSKETAIDALLALLEKDKPGINIQKIKELILEREEVENTSYGRGFAFPHARTNEVDDMYVLLGVSHRGLDDKTPDGIPVTVVVLLLTPSHISKLYLQTLSAFASFARMEGNREKIAEARSRADVVDIIWQSGVMVEKELTVKDIMRRDVATVTPADSLKKVANVMFKNRLSALAVIDDEGNLLGQITDKDLIQAVLPDYKTLISNLNYSMDTEPFEELLKQEDKFKVEQVYTRDHEIAHIDTRIVEVAGMMIFKDLRRVFVTEGTKLIGILLRKDIANMIIRG